MHQRFNSTNRRSVAVSLLLMFCLLVLGTVVSTEPAAAAGSSSTPIWVGAPHRCTYAGTSGRPASSLPGRHAPVYGVPGYSYLHDWAMDCYAPAGTAVRVYVAPKNSSLGSQITASVLSVTPACGSGVIGNGGYAVFVGIYHSGVRVGSLAFAHVWPDFNRSGSTTGADTGFRGSISRWGGYIGTIGRFTRNPCWDVANVNGHHTHLEFVNVRNYSCYRNLAAGSTIAAGEYQGYLGGSYASARNRPCPAGA